MLDADVRDGRAHCALGRHRAGTPRVDDGPVRVLLRPEQLRLSAPPAGGRLARVRGVDFYGHDSRVWLDLAGGLTVSARLDGPDVPGHGRRGLRRRRGHRAALPSAGGRACHRPLVAPVA